MKRIILAFALLVENLTIFGQSSQEVVFLKNGSIVRGEITEQIPNESLKIQTADGNIFVFNMEEVEKITKEAKKDSTRVSSLKIESNSFRPKGYRGFFDLDGGFRVGTYGDGYIGFTTSHGYQTCPYFFIGAGLGVEYHVGWSLTFLPIFGNMHFNFLNKRCSPFLDIKGGYSPVNGKGGYLSTAFGVNYQFTPKVGINFSLGYTMQKADFWFYIPYYYSGYINYYFYTEKETMHHLGFKLGIEF